MTPPPLPRRAVLVVVALVAVAGLLAAFLLGRPGTADRAGSPTGDDHLDDLGSPVADPGRRPPRRRYPIPVGRQRSTRRLRRSPRAGGS